MLFKETCMNLEKPLTAYVNLLSFPRVILLNPLNR